MLKTPSPDGVSSTAQLNNQVGAEAVYANAKSSFDFALYGYAYSLVRQSELLSDEMRWADFSYAPTAANVDARRTVGGPNSPEAGDYSWQEVLSSRSDLLVAIPGLLANEPVVNQSSVGEAYALVGYAELMIAEAYCGGTPLSQIAPAGGIQYGTPLTNDSLLGVAQGHFDSALAHAAGNDTIASLAAIGLGRTLIDRGQWAAAATAVATVSPSFVYNASMEPGGYSAQAPHRWSFYDAAYYTGGISFSVAEQEGGNGLNFISANDPRLSLDSSLTTLDRGRWYLPMKFEINFGTIPLAGAVEAQLISAEAALQSNQPAVWLTILNTLRNGGCQVSSGDTVCSLGTGQVTGQIAGLPSLTDPGTVPGRDDLMFRERAFWLFGTGARLGDLRRLVRQYGRDPETVFPTGSYAQSLDTAIPTYGSDVALTLPTAAKIASGVINETNPNYKGCITPTSKA